MSTNIPSTEAGLPDPLQNTRYKFSKDVPRVSDSDTIVTLESPGGGKYKIHAHLLAFVSGYLKAILAGDGMRLERIVLPRLAIVGVGGRAERDGHIGAYPWLNDQVVQLFIDWTYKRCERTEDDSVMSEKDLATYLFDQEEYYHPQNEDDDDYHHPTSSLCMFNDMLIGAWILGNGLRAPEFQNTIMTLLYAHTEYVLWPRERCELSLRTFLSYPFSPQHHNAYSTTQHQSVITAAGDEHAKVYSRFDIPPGSALERFLIIRAGTYILCPDRAQELIDNRDLPGSVPDDLTLPLMRGIDGPHSVALSLFLAEEMSKRHYGFPGVMMHQEDGIYV